MIELMDEEKPRRSAILSPVRFLLHWLIKIVVMAFMAIRYVLRPRPVRLGLLAVLLVGGAFWALSGATSGANKASTQQVNAAPVAAVASSQPPQATAVQQYLRAQASYDARGMWSALSEDLKQAMASSNTTVDQLQSELDSAKQQGRKYMSATYVGGMPISDGRTVYFYVLSVDTSQGNVDVPYIYVVGSDGKIVSIQ